MPQMDGIETLQKAKEEGLIREDCPVIALTANAVVGAREKYLEAGFDDYLSKPVEVAALERMLEKHLPGDKWTLRSRSKKEEVTEEKHSDDIDMQEGLKYCAGDESFYHELLRDYHDSYSQRLDELKEALAGSDMKNYAVKIHALKSVSKTIGAMGLSEKAAELEKAAKEGDTGIVKEKHPVFAAEYERIVTLIGDMDLPVTNDPEDDINADEDGIIEFFPDDTDDQGEDS